jgi:hypothetical protein
MLYGSVDLRQAPDHGAERAALLSLVQKGITLSDKQKD